MNGQAHRLEFHAASSDSPLRRLKAILHSNRLCTILEAAFRTSGDAGSPVASCSVTRVHPRGDGGFVVEAAANLENGSVRQCFAEIPSGDPSLHLENAQRKLAKQNRRCGISDRGNMFRISADSEYGVIIRPKGVDESIAGLMTLRAFEQLAKQLPPEISARLDSSCSARLLAHRLLRRAVIGINREGDRGGGYILKLYKKHSAKAQQAVTFTALLERTSFGDTSPVHVPETLALLRSWPGYLMVRAEGPPLSALGGADRAQGMRLAGAAIGRLHRLPLRMQESHSPSDECALLRSWVMLVSSVYPALSRDIGRAYNHVERLLVQPDTQPFTLVHRDFHDGQLLISGKTATLLDFDTACNGEPAQDIGNFLGHLDFAALSGKVDSEAAADEILTGYVEAHGEPNAARVEAHRRATLLRLACIYVFSSEHGKLSPLLAAMALGDNP